MPRTRMPDVIRHLGLGIGGGIVRVGRECQGAPFADLVGGYVAGCRCFSKD